MRPKTFGKELALDIHNCDTSTFTRKNLRKFFKELCKLIDMDAVKIVFCDEFVDSSIDIGLQEHLVGISAVQFIRTSNITVHMIDMMQRIYLNIFSCKDFESDKVMDFTVTWFRGKLVNYEEFIRY